MSYVTKHWDPWEALEAIEACPTIESAEWEACTTRKPALVQMAKWLGCYRGHSGATITELAKLVAAAQWALRGDQ